VYVADCKLEVESSLTIDPGAIVKFSPGAYLDVLTTGTLTAVGTDSLPIVFTSIKDDAHGGASDGGNATAAARNDWGCQGSCGDLNIQGDGSVLDYVWDLYGSNGVYVQAASVQIKNSVFAHHNTYGVVLDESFDTKTTYLTGNTFFDNSGYPLHLGAAVFLDASNIFHDPADPDVKNAKQCIEVAADLDQLTMLGVTEVGFLFSGRKISAELVLALGVIFKSQNDPIYVEAGGSFINGPNVLFTSYKDDALGGDCTGDGSTTPMASDWEGLWIDDGTDAGYAASSEYIRYSANSGNMPLP
jgi:hypothetical protein